MVNIELKKVNKIFKPDVHVLKGIDLTIRDKEFMVLVGPSGCGKSTCLNIIAGLEYVTDGNIFFGDVDVSELPPKERNLAMVFQSYALYPHMNVRENMSFALKLAKVDKEIINRNVVKAAKILEIESLLDRKPKELSGGQRQRVALGRCIVRDPTVFLFDEPLSNLDAKLRTQMRGEIIKLQKQLQTTLIYVTHDQVEAMSMADRITILNGGYIQQVGTPSEVYNTPRNIFVAGFIGAPSMNFMRCELQGSNLVFGQNQYSINSSIVEKIKTANSTDLILGIRPEHIQITPDKRQDAFKVKIDVVEYLGANTIIEFEFKGKFASLAVANGFYSAKMGDHAYVSFPNEKIHVFDAKSELNLIHKNPIQQL
ncbi:Trehalose/maltose import ATP-binding protein MalK [Candidatus Lokiarchaeum ossiferum]|uniref:Trehalose/maltose import ATP-binding protein MalK n=1 Tax=Candidatus Lokiarchaeum ossiferum TaxID=2951803 RepID=A0ABY6HL78_9ARCH|nr:Trehalose/maltose import ATP-binding protein MalK [Candidatus Lokiarchaeum sp. B-35]